jgi:hypothetical protein
LTPIFQVFRSRHDFRLGVRLAPFFRGLRPFRVSPSKLQNPTFKDQRFIQLSGDKKLNKVSDIRIGERRRFFGASAPISLSGQS